MLQSPLPSIPFFSKMSLFLIALIFLIQTPSTYSACTGTEFEYPDGSCDLQCSSPFTQSVTSGVKYCTPPCSSTQYYTWEKKCAKSCPSPYVKQIDSQINYCFLPCKDPLLYYYPGTKACQSYCEATTTIVDKTYLTCTGDTYYSLLANLFLVPPEGKHASFVSMNILMEYIRYLDVDWPDRLENFVESRGRTILGIRGGLGMSQGFKDKLAMGDMPTLWLKRGLHSSFLVNFWGDLMLLLILFGVAWIFWGLEKLRIRYNWTGLSKIQPYLDRIRVLCVYNLIIMVFGLDLGNIIFYTTVECTAPKFLAWGFFSFLSLMIALAVALYYLIKIFKLIRGLELSQQEQNLSMLEGIQITKGKNFYVASNQVIHNGYKGNVNRLNRYFYLIYVCRGAMPMLLASWFTSNPMIQSVLQMFFSLVVVAYIVYMRPFKKLLNYAQIVIIEGLVLIMNICVVVLIAMELHGVQDTMANVLFADTVIIGNTLINVVIIFIFILKLIDYFREVRKFRKQSPKGWKLACVYFLVIPLQQGAFGFEELLEDIETSNEIRKSMALRGLAMSQNVSLFQKTKKSDLNTDHITILNMNDNQGDQSTRRVLRHRDDMDYSPDISTVGQLPNESPLLTGGGIPQENDSPMIESYTINERSLTPETLHQVEYRGVSRDNTPDITEEYVEQEARRRAFQENADAYETREARRREGESHVQLEVEPRPLTREENEIHQQSYSLPFRKVTFTGVGPEREENEDGDSQEKSRKIIELTKDEVRQRRRNALRVSMPFVNDYDRLDQEDYKADNRFTRERLKSPAPGLRRLDFIDDPFFKGMTPYEYGMEIKPVNTGTKKKSWKPILKSTTRLEDNIFEIADSFVGSDPYSYGPTDAELDELRKRRKTEEERLRTEQEERDEMERLRRAEEMEIQRLRKAEEEEIRRLKRLEEERLRKEQEEREEIERLRRAEEEELRRLRKAEEEELLRLRRAAEEEKLRKAKEDERERLRLIEEERARKQREKDDEERRAREDELIRLRKAEEERLRRAREDEEERLRRFKEKEDEERRARQEELARLRKAEEERLRRISEEEELARLRKAEEDRKRLIAESNKRIMLSQSGDESIFNNTRTMYGNDKPLTLAKMESEFENMKASGLDANFSSLLTPESEINLQQIPVRGRGNPQQTAHDLEVVNASRQTSAKHRSHMSVDRSRAILPKEKTEFFDDAEWELNMTKKSLGRSTIKRSTSVKKDAPKKPPVFYTVAKPESKLKKGKSFKNGENLATALQDILDDVDAEFDS